MTTILDIPGGNPPNPFYPSIEAAVTSTNYSPLVQETAENIVQTVTASSDPSYALWQLWDAFFRAVASSSSHEPHLALLGAIRAQPPTQPNNVTRKYNIRLHLRSQTEADEILHWSRAPRFGWAWRDTYDALREWRDWDGIREPSTEDGSRGSELRSSGSQLFLRFVKFSAMLLKKCDEEASADQAIWVFYTCKDVLERVTSPYYEPKKHRMSSEQVWALDVRVAAAWLRDGGWALWKMDYKLLQEGWAAALNEKTELWPREDGLTRERWQLWKQRLWVLSTDEASVDEETRGMVKEAYEVVEGILREA